MNKPKVEDAFEWKNNWNQYFATFAVNLIFFSHGMAVGWLPLAIPILMSENTPLKSGPLTNEDVSWIGSISNVGAVLGSLSLGYLISFIGCKRSILFLTVPEVIFWLLIYFGDHYYYILFARILHGYAAGGLISSIILYISQIANDNIRGTLGTSTLMTRALGILFGYVFGVGIPYKYVPVVSVLIPIVFFIIFSLLPNTPQFYLRKLQTHKAKVALMYYKGCKNDKCDNEANAICKEFERLKAIANVRQTGPKTQFSDFCNQKALTGIAIGFGLTVFVTFSGNLTILSYSTMIFDKTHTIIDLNVSAVMMPVANLIGALLTTFLADKLGRRILNMFSLFGSAFGLFAISLYQYLYLHGFDLTMFVWVPVVSLSFCVFASSVGIQTTVYLCCIEYLPAKIQNPGMAIVCVLNHFSTFTSLYLFPILLEIIDLYGCMMIFGVVSVFGGIFIACLNETNGRSLDNVNQSEKIVKIKT